jgi:chromosome segregation ATPase
MPQPDNAGRAPSALSRNLPVDGFHRYRLEAPMASKKQPPEPSLRTILERIEDVRGSVESQGSLLQDTRALLEDTRVRVGSQNSLLQDTRDLLEDTRVRVGSQNLLLEDIRGSVESQGSLLQDTRVRVDSQNLLLEDMRSQNRVTIEAVEATRRALEDRIDRLEQDTRSRDGLLEVAIRDLKATVQQNGMDIRDLGGKVEALTRLEARVTAIERRIP